MASLIERQDRGPAVANEAGARRLRLEDGRELEITERRYPGGARALLLVEAASREPYSVLTVNIPGTQLQPGEILVKTWSENQRVAAQAVKDPRFEDTGRRVPAGGYGAEAQVWRYRPDAPEPPQQSRDEWRGTLNEPINRAVTQHGVEAFAAAARPGAGAGRAQRGEDQAMAAEAARARLDAGVKAERVYAVLEDGTIHNTATKRDEWVPVDLAAARDGGDGAPRPPGGVPRQGGAPGASAPRDPAKAEPEVDLSMN